MVTLVQVRGLLGQSPLGNGAGPRVTPLNSDQFAPLTHDGEGLGVCDKHIEDRRDIVSLESHAAWCSVFWS